MSKQMAKVRVRRLASQQVGRIAWRQLREIGVADSLISCWVKQGYLHPKLPGVYAVGHDAPSVEADLAAALLYAGPGAMLSHGTAAWWYGLIEHPPARIHVSTPRKCRSRRGITVHQRRKCERTWHEGLPVTTLPQTLLDYAATASLNQVRVALANAEYQKVLNVPEVEALLGKGRPGSARLRTALRRHQPRLAYTRSRTERTFLDLCESAGIPLPEVNVRLAGWTVDFYWRQQGVVVEVDGHDNHHTRAQRDRDRRKDLALRNAGRVVNRYSREQVETAGQAVLADVAATLANRAA
jgi:predicted transcriptional regulator of viral defense system